MDEQQKELGKKQEESMTIPRSLFLILLWSYKKGVELRDRAVPGEEVIKIIREQIPDLKEAGIYIEDIEGAQSVVWRYEEWRTAGERTAKMKVMSTNFNHNADMIAEAIFKKAPMLGLPFCRALAYNAVKLQDWSSLAPFGIDIEKLKL